MASRNLARGRSQEHTNAEARLDEARKKRDAVEDRRDAPSEAGVDQLEASVALDAADEQVAAREAWMRWIERDY
jgi:hypothetical protein